MMSDKKLLLHVTVNSTSFIKENTQTKNTLINTSTTTKKFNVFLTAKKLVFIYHYIQIILTVLNFEFEF